MTAFSPYSNAFFFCYGCWDCINKQFFSINVNIQFRLIFTSDVFIITQVFCSYIVESYFRSFKMQYTFAIIYINSISFAFKLFCNCDFDLTCCISRNFNGYVSITAISDYSKVRYCYVDG